MGHPLERLSAYLDGELQPEERLEVERHLQGCPVCQETLDGYGQVHRHFGGLLQSVPVSADAGRAPVRRAKAYRVFAIVALAASLVVAMGFMVPSVRAYVTGWFAGGLFSASAADTAARAAFKVYLPSWLPAEAKQLPVLLSDPDQTGRFQHVEVVWIGASEASPDPFLMLSQQAQSSQDLRDLITDGQPVAIGKEPGVMAERTWHEGSGLKRDVRVVWHQDGTTFFLQTGVLSSDDLLRVARGMKPAGPMVAQSKAEPAKPGTWYDAGPVERFAPSSVTHFPEQHFFLVRLPAGFVAFYDLDPHLRHLVTWDPVERLFVSPAHGERYTMDGTPIAGPAPRGLDRYPVQIANGNITVDRGSLLPGTAPTGSGNSTTPSGRP